MPSIGRGVDQQHEQWHERTTQTGSVVKMVGDSYHASLLPGENLHLVEINADHWKT
jgi:hypothetical protein